MSHYPLVTCLDRALLGKLFHCLDYLERQSDNSVLAPLVLCYHHTNSNNTASATVHIPQPALAVSVIQSLFVMLVDGGRTDPDPTAQSSACIRYAGM